MTHEMFGFRAAQPGDGNNNERQSSGPASNRRWDGSGRVDVEVRQVHFKDATLAESVRTGQKARKWNRLR